MKIATVLDHIDSGHMALPEFQRGYVWNRDQVRGLFDSLYRRHPVGGLLVWATEAKTAARKAIFDLAWPGRVTARPEQLSRRGAESAGRGSRPGEDRRLSLLHRLAGAARPYYRRHPAARSLLTMPLRCPCRTL